MAALTSPKLHRDVLATTHALNPYSELTHNKRHTIEFLSKIQFMIDAKAQEQAPNYEIEERVFTNKLMNVQEEMIGLCDQITSLKQKRDALVHEVAQKNIFPAHNKRNNFFADHDPLKEQQAYYASMIGHHVAKLSKDAKELCYYEKEEVSKLASNYKDSQKIQDTAELINIRLEQRRLLEQEVYFLRGEVLLQESLTV